MTSTKEREMFGGSDVKRSMPSFSFPIKLISACIAIHVIMHIIQ